MSESDTAEKPKRASFFVRHPIKSLLAIAAALFGILIYFTCCHSVPLRIEKRITYIESPLYPDGHQVDYFADLETKFAGKIPPPEENGFRLLVRALGKKFVLHDKTPNDGLWKVACEKLEIDPMDDGEYDYESPIDFLLGHFSQSGPTERWEMEKLHAEMVGEFPLSLGLHPYIEPWIEANRPFLEEVFLEAVKYEHFCPLLLREGETGRLYDSYRSGHRILPEIARGATIMVAYRLGESDVEGAWEYLIGLHRLQRHLVRSPDFFTALLGIHVQSIIWENTLMFLGCVSFSSPDQLGRFLDDLEKLPSVRYDWRNWLLQVRYYPLDLAQAYQFHWNGDLNKSMGNYQPSGIIIAQKLRGINWNTVFIRVNDFHDSLLETMENAMQEEKSERRKEIIEQGRTLALEKFEIPFNREYLIYLSMTTVHTRSAILAYVVSSSTHYDILRLLECVDIDRSRFQLLKTALLLEQYRLNHGRYPASIADLPCPPEIDPHSGIEPFIIRPPISAVSICSTVAARTAWTTAARGTT